MQNYCFFLNYARKVCIFAKIVVLLQSILNTIPMKRLFPILLACLLPFMVQAQESIDNRLEPIMVDGLSSSDMYHTIVLDTLIPERLVTFAYVVRPSFDPEYALIYNRTKKKFIYSEVASSATNIWYSLSSKENYTVNRWELKADPNVAESIRVLLRTAIATAVAPKDGLGFMGGEDGTTYQFIADSYTAECWSPDSGNNAELVRVMDTVCQVVKTQDQTLLQALLLDINRLTEAYERYVCQ